MLKKAIGYNLFRSIGYPKLLPMNVTISLTYRCTSLCKSCDIGKNFIENPKLAKNELTVSEYNKIFQSLGQVDWFIFSGGEPFMKIEIDEIIKSAYKHCKPSIIIIPTNGLLPTAIKNKTESILKDCPNARLTINLSIDGIAEQHDYIRGMPGNWKRSLETLENLKSLKKYPNLEIGVHTVISKLNVKSFKEIQDYILENFKPDSYITEIAEERAELSSIGKDITPEYEEYSEAIDYLIKHLKSKEDLTAKQRFRLKYYEMVKNWRKERTQIYPCFAGWASCQIDSKGEVWMCCTRAQSIGNLRDVNYDFSELWFNGRAKEQRRSIKAKECHCPLASAAYSSIMFNPKGSGSVVFDMVKDKLIG